MLDKKLKLLYYAISGQEVIAVIYEKDGHKIVFVRQPHINIEFGIYFRDVLGNRIEDKDVQDLLTYWLFAE